jgi:hypothetical protein
MQSWRTWTEQATRWRRTLSGERVARTCQASGQRRLGSMRLPDRSKPVPLCAAPFASLRSSALTSTRRLLWMNSECTVRSLGDSRNRRRKQPPDEQ